MEIVSELRRREKFKTFTKLYPEEGPLRREMYPKHMAFFRAGIDHRERAFMAGNRIGKTLGVGGYELVLHLTGEYPEWWEGRRFDGPIKAWAAGDTNKTVKDILQAKIVGPVGEIGSGLIPRELIIGKPPMKPGIPDAIEGVRVRHKTGLVSTLTFKSYEQGREAFQGTEQDVILLDEEPPYPIYVECLMRTMATGDFRGGMVLCTFTPLEGLSETVLAFLPGGKLKEGPQQGKFVIMATWDDAPHLTDKEKQELLQEIPPYQRDARTKGIPQLGSGAIYPVPESEIVVKPFNIPEYWPRVYGFDVGWNKTAAPWGTWDRESDIVYLYSTHYQGQAEPPIHAAAIKARGDWIPGVIDPAARGRSQKDGEQLLSLYQELGLSLYVANNAVEAGIYKVWQRLSSGRLKVFSVLEDWLGEYRIYRRDDHGRVVKERDHLMDATRYLVISGLDIAKTKGQEEDDYYRPQARGVNPVTGY